jgi:hypothetical protein
LIAEKREAPFFFVYAAQFVLGFSWLSLFAHSTFFQGGQRKLGIQIIYLPPYFLNLNLIERLWKFVKMKSLYNQHNAHYEQPRNNFLLSEANRQNLQQDLDTLLVAKFQSFKYDTIQP